MSPPSSITGFPAIVPSSVLGAFSPEERPVLADMLDRFVNAVDEFVTDLADVPA